jgi:hypothetical protein
VFKADRYNALYIVRITSDLLSGDDVRMIPSEVTSALQAGSRKIVFSVTVGSLANQMQLTSLLLRCKEITRKFNAQLMFVEKNNGEQSAYGNICRTVKVPLYTIGLEESSETDLYDQRAEFKGVT